MRVTVFVTRRKKRAMTDTANYKIGRYEATTSLGKGSQGSVYLARDPTLDRHVALKVLTASQSELAGKAENGAPLEALIASKLKHPNIVPIFDAGECDIGPYLVFEYVEGDTLAQVMKDRGPYAIEEAIPMFRAILGALAAAHSADILHLDLSPRNILLDKSGTPRVMDFGLSQFADQAPDTSGAATGTLRYMSPEHFSAKSLGTWTDVFALGSTFYELVTGQHAMQGSTLDAIRRRIMASAVDLALLNDYEHGARFGRFLAGAFEQEMEGRYSDCTAMGEAFELFVKEAGLEESAKGTGGTHSTVDFLMRRMQRKRDFPTISSTLADINRLTGDDASASASADKLANVILRDLALTSKLLKLVNSAFYGSRTAEVKSISQAVVFLGVEKIRMVANSLTLFGALKGDSAVLRDSMTKSFLSGLIARHLAKEAELPDAEEAFICGMCQNLGENLVIYYFEDEYGEIEALRTESALGKNAASRGVLGVSYAELGAAVASSWSLPQSIIDAIEGMPAGKVLKPADDDKQMRDIAVFANLVCDALANADADEADNQMHSLVKRFEPSVGIDDGYALKLINAGFEKLRQYAPIFEINVSRSDYCQSVQRWLDDRLRELEEEAGSASEG